MILKAILQTAEKALRKRDDPSIEILVEKAVETKEDLPDSLCYADFLYLAACYADATGNHQVANRLIKTIKQDFPNYNSRERLDKPYGQIQWDGDPRTNLREHELRLLAHREFRRFRGEYRESKVNHLMGKYPMHNSDKRRLGILHNLAFYLITRKRHHTHSCH